MTATTTETMDAMTRLQKMQDGYFTFVKRVEEPVVRFAGEMADTVARYVPERPMFMAKLPRMTELVDNQLKFRKRFVDEQAMFVRKMMKAMDPVVVRVDTIPKPTVEKTVHAKAAPTHMGPRRMPRKAA